MRLLRTLALLALALPLAGCYHATVTTGMAPGTQTIDQPWAMSFVYGLIPPPTVDAAAQCPQGVARVETQLSFLNQLVSFLTAGIITPMHITVTCAAGTSQADAVVPAGADRPAIREAVAQGADRAAATGEAFLIRFE